MKSKNTGNTQQNDDAERATHERLQQLKQKLHNQNKALKKFLNHFLEKWSPDRTQTSKKKKKDQPKQ